MFRGGSGPEKGRSEGGKGLKAAWQEGVGDRDLLELFGQEARGIGHSSKAAVKRRSKKPFREHLQALHVHKYVYLYILDVIKASL